MNLLVLLHICSPIFPVFFCSCSFAFVYQRGPNTDEGKVSRSDQIDDVSTSNHFFTSTVIDAVVYTSSQQNVLSDKTGNDVIDSSVTGVEDIWMIQNGTGGESITNSTREKATDTINVTDSSSSCSNSSSAINATVTSTDASTTTITTQHTVHNSSPAESSQCPEMCYCPPYGAWAAHLVPYLRQHLGTKANSYTDDVLQVFLLQQLIVNAESPKSIVGALFDRIMSEGNGALTLSLLWTRLGITRCLLKGNSTFYLNAEAETRLFPQVALKESVINQMSLAQSNQNVDASSMKPAESRDLELEPYQLYNISFNCEKGSKVVVSKETTLYRYGRWTSIGCQTSTEEILSLDRNWSLIELDVTNENDLWFLNVMVSDSKNNTTFSTTGDGGNISSVHFLPNVTTPSGSFNVPWLERNTVFPTIQKMSLLNTSLTIQQLIDALVWFQKGREVSLKNNNLPDFNCTQLTPFPASWSEFTLSFSGLTSVPACLLRSSLVWLDLSNNRIDDISVIQLPNYLPSVKLELLNLTNNNIRDVGIITNMNLHFLDLAGNQISHLNKLSFARLPNLTYLDLSHNRLHKLDPGSFKSLVTLQYLYLQHNYLEHFDHSVSPLKQYPPLECKIYLNHNRFSHPPFQSELYNPGAAQSVYAADNPFACDCDMMSYTEATKNSSLTASYVDRSDMRCMLPVSLKGVPLDDIAFTDTCPIVLDCPPGCVCSLHHNDSVVTVDCSAVQDFQFPRVLPQIHQLRLEFQSGGSTQTSPMFEDSEYLLRVISINASGRGLMHLPDFMCEVLKQTEVLDLSFNKLRRLPACFQTRPKDWPRLELWLAHNPWTCECDTAYFSSWLARMIPGQAKDGVVVSDIEKVRCDARGSLVVEWDSSHCTLISYLPWAATLAVMLVVAAVLGPVLYVYRLKAIVMLHARFHVRPFTHTPHYNEDDFDYEALLVPGNSAVSLDWVVNSLLPRVDLTGHRICLPDRDFLLGASIAEAYTSSVMRAKAMVCLLSPQIAGDEWWLYVFQLARAEHARNPDRKLLMVLLEHVHVDDLAQLPDEVREFLKTNTYLSTKDPWFWKKIFFYLPDPPKPLPLP